MPDVPRVTAIEVGDPVVLFIFMETNDYPFHAWLLV